MESSKEKQDE